MLLALTAALHPPVRSCLERTVKSYRRKNKRVPELRLALGPMLEGVTGNGSYFDLFGAVWALALTRDGLKLARLGVAGWYEVTPLEPLPLLPSSARHIGLAFDQAARPVIAWEVSSQIFIRQYDGGQYVTRGPFAGVDPVLWIDAGAIGIIPSSDVLLFALAPERLTVQARVQSQTFGTANTIYTYNAPMRLETVITGSKRFELLFTSMDGGSMSKLISDVYPLIESDELTTVTASYPATGIYFGTVLVVDIPFDQLTASTASYPATGNYLPLVIIENPNTDSLTTSTASYPTTGNYAPLVIIHNPNTDAVTTSTATHPVTGNYVDVMIAVAPSTDTLTSAVATYPIGGSYVPV